VPLGVLAAYKQGTLDRPHRDGLLGARLLGAGVRHRLLADLSLRDQAQLAAGAGLQRIGDGFGGFLQRLILPSVTLSVIYIALIARMTRTSVLEVLGEDYIRTARAKGQVEIKVLFRHALRTPPCRSSP
jgi:peptide/nickel transport system permease protein